MSVVNVASVTRDSLSFPPVNPPSQKIPGLASAGAAAETAPGLPIIDPSAAALFARRLATVVDAETRQTQAPTLDDTIQRKEIAARLRTAFVEHARTRLRLASETDATSIIGAFFATQARSGADAPGQWLENDADLMLCLAKAGQLFADEPEAADLDPGHRRLLANSLALALTETIDWPAALSAETADGAAVFHDGLTLRNANALSIKDASAAIDARIGKALAASATTKGLAAIIPQLRAALIDDPTLSFQPLSPSVRYGSRDWAKLWVGIQACTAAGMDVASMTAAEIIAFGQAVNIRAAQQDQASVTQPSLPPGQTETTPYAIPLPSQIGLLLMAHAAGKVDLARLHEADRAEITEKVQAFAAEEFRTELALGEVIDRLMMLDPPPTARSIAEDALKDKGLDPMAIVIEEPISSKGKRVSHELHEFYVKFNDLSEIEPNRFNRALIAKVGADTPLYRNVYDRKFDAYISDYMDAHKKLVGLMLETARKDGYNPGDDGSSVSIHRARITSPPDVRTHGLFINCANGQYLYRYFLSPSGTIERIPDGMAQQDWLVQNRHTALTQEDLKKIQRASGSDMNFSCVLEQEFAGEAGRIDDVIEAHFRPRLLELKRKSESTQDGVSKADRVLEMIVPFYGVYTGIKRGDYVSAYLSFVSGAFVLIPSAFAASKLVAVSRKALTGGVRVAVNALWEHGPINAATRGLKHAGAYLPSMGMHAAYTSGTLLDALAPVPVGTHSFGELIARSYRRLTPAALHEISDELESPFSRLVATLRKEIAEPEFPNLKPPPLFHFDHRPRHPSSGLTTGLRTPIVPSKTPRAEFTLVPRTGARPPVVPEISGVSRVPAVLPLGNAQPSFVKAVDRYGDTLWLRRFGNAYSLFDPYRLQPVGSVLVRGRNGVLTPSLQVAELAYHAVSDPATLSMLARAQLSTDGTITVNGKTFASIAGAYVEIVPRMPTSAGEPLAWHVGRATAHAATDAASDMPTLLTYSRGQGGWIDLAHRAQDLELPIGILERYRVADASLRQALAQAQVSEDGTILFGAKRYARVNGHYLELVADHAATTPEQPVWRVAGAPLSGSRDGAPRLAWNKDLGVWHEPQSIPALRGGGRYSALAGVNINPVKRVIVDDGPTNAMAGRVVLRPGNRHAFKAIPLKHTQTVEVSETILRDATDLTHYPWWAEEFDDYLDIVVLNLERSAYAKANTSLADPAAADRMRTSIKNDMRTFLTDLYARSETFRGLVNNAKAKGILTKDRSWAIQISLPATLTDGTATLADQPRVAGAAIPRAPYSGEKKIVVPDIKSPPFFSAGDVIDQNRQLTFGIIVDGGKHAPQRAPSCTVHEFVHFLTLKDDPFDFSDRGAVEYLTQRIMKEAGIDEPRRLTYVTPLNGEVVYEYNTSETETLHRYADAEDEYLAARFPMPDPPAAIWNPSRDNDR